MKKFQLLPLTLAMGAAFITQAHATEAESEVVLATEYVTIDRQGTKVKTNVVTTADKDESTETDMRGLLKSEASIDFSGGNGTSQYVSIRGMSHNSVDLKIDNAYSDSPILYHQGKFMLDPALVKIVSVQKGAGSASAGIGATNGAIIAKTLDAEDLLKGSDKDLGVKVNTGYSENSDSFNYGVSAYGKSDNFDFLISANRADENNYKASKDYKNKVNGSNEILYSALDKQGYLAKVGANLDNHRFVLSHMRDIHKGVRTVREEFTAFGGANDRQSPAYRETSQDLTNLEYIGKDVGFADVVANVYLLKNKRYSADDSGCGYCGNIKGPTTTVIETKGANINFDSHITADSLLKYGVNYRHQQVEPERMLKKGDLTNIDIKNPNFVNKQDTPGVPEKIKASLQSDVQMMEKQDVGVYVESINDIGPVTVTAGLRYDHYEYHGMDGKKNTDNSLNPSLGLIWQATPSLSLNASHNYATRSPRLYDALLTQGHRGMVSIADGTKAERARNTELGFNFSQDMGDKGKITLDGGYFWQRIDDALVNPQNRHDAVTIREVINKGHITNDGYELNASYQIGGFSARIGVADSDPEFHGLDSNNELNPEFAFKVGRTITSSLAYRFAEPNLEIGVRNRDVAEVVGTVNVNSTANPVRPGYNVTDIYANWKPYGNDKMNVNFAVNNVADKYYHPHSQRANNTNVNPAQGRDFRVGINYKF